MLFVGFGWLLLVVGVVGVILPVLHGMIFLLLGLLILSTEYDWPHRILRPLAERFPTLGRLLDRAAQRVSGWMERWGHDASRLRHAYSPRQPASEGD